MSQENVRENAFFPILGMTPLLITPSELGSLLSLAPRTIYNRINTGGDLPPVLRMGRLPRFALSDVHAWIDKKRTPAAPASPPPRRRGRPTKAEQMARGRAV